MAGGGAGGDAPDAQALALGLPYDVSARMGSVAAALLAVQNGASLVRVHDVKETVDAINVWMELK